MNVIQGWGYDLLYQLDTSYPHLRNLRWLARPTETHLESLSDPIYFTLDQPEDPWPAPE